VALIFVASLSISSYVIFQKRLIPRYGALGTTAYAQWAGLVWLLPLLFVPGVWPKLAGATPTQWWPVVWLGLVPSALSYVLWGALVAQFPVSRAVSFLYFVPVCASLMGWAFLGEAMSPLALLGGAVAICGVAIVNAGRR
jgi:drug/metabolite transporter (DMT)-like permease